MPAFRFIIFDMDDTLISSTTTWQRAEKQLFHWLGQPYPPEIIQHHKGMSARDIGRTIHRHLPAPQISAEECGHMLRELLLDGFRCPLVQMPGADSLLRDLVGRYRLCVASGSPLEGVRLALEQCGWLGFFDVLLSSEGLPHGKPAPDIFLEAARRADCAPGEALVVEDSLIGVQAAKQAGMTCYAVPSHDDPAIAQTADRVFLSLDFLAPVLRTQFTQ